MGHVFALKRLGIDATAPMFVPGLGAVIFLKQQHFSPREDARHGLAGPIWGLGASVAAALLGFIFHSPVCLVIAQWNAWINLSNLLPVWTLDGARGFHALQRRDRIAAGFFFVAAWVPSARSMACSARISRRKAISARSGTTLGSVSPCRPLTGCPRRRNHDRPPTRAHKISRACRLECEQVRAPTERPSIHSPFHAHHYFQDR
jgi:hypothetical protein